MKLLLAMLLLASSVLAQTYVKVDENASGTFYVDKQSIKKDKDVLLFTGKVETNQYIELTDFATDCTNYTILLQQILTTDFIFTKRSRKPQINPVEKNTPVEKAVYYVCTGTLKKSSAGVSVPQAE